MLVGVEQAVEVEARSPLVLCLKNGLGVVQADPPDVLGELAVGSHQILCGGAQPTVCRVNLLDERVVGHRRLPLASGVFAIDPDPSRVSVRAAAGHHHGHDNRWRRLTGPMAEARNSLIVFPRYPSATIRSTRARVADTSIPCSVPPRRMGPAIASTSGGRPAATSFCIELRKASGTPSNDARIGSGATLAPSATPMAQASLTHPSNPVHRPGSERTTPSGPPEAVVASAKCAKKQSLLQSIVTSSSLTSQPNPTPRSSSDKASARARVAGLGATCTSAHAERCRTRSGPICSASTQIVPGKTGSAP